jgi:hypothetical protein
LHAPASNVAGNEKGRVLTLPFGANPEFRNYFALDVVDFLDLVDFLGLEDFFAGLSAFLVSAFGASPLGASAATAAKETAANIPAIKVVSILRMLNPL